MTILDDILDASTDSKMPVSDLLRKVQIVATRLGAVEIVAWVRGEISGYDPDEPIPACRKIQSNVLGLFTAPMH